MKSARTKLHLVDANTVDAEPSPAVSDDRKREILLEVIASLDRAVDELGDLDPWKWACIGIRRRMALTVASSLDDVDQAYSLDRLELLRQQPGQLPGTSAG